MFYMFSICPSPKMYLLIGRKSRGRRGKIVTLIYLLNTRIWAGSLVTSKIQKNKKLKSNARAAMSVGGFGVSLWWRQSGLWTHSWPSYSALILRSTPRFPDHLPFEVLFYVCTIYELLKCPNLNITTVLTLNPYFSGIFIWNHVYQNYCMSSIEHRSPLNWTFACWVP